MRRLFLMAAVLSGAVASAGPAARAPERLYFALELRHEGKVIGTPKFLGHAGKVVRAERKQPGAAVPDYRLALSPTVNPSKGKFDISLDVFLPDARGSGHFSLHHGEERKLALGKGAGELEISLLVMKVDSPEFRALMQQSAREDEAAKAASI